MQKINKINQYLLENYPNIWNTRLVWMLLLGFIVHLLFFFIGFVSHSSPWTLQKSGAISDYFTSGLIFVHIIISVLMIVGWLVFMFKNNAFKSFYPSSGKKLFFELVQYFIIIFVSVSFYLSYMTGFQLFINYKYDDAKMAKNVATINQAYAFLSQDLELYTLEQRKSPKPFSEFYCETNLNKIDKNQKYFVYHDRVYQFFSLYEKTVTEKDKKGEFIYPEEERKNKTPLAYEDSKDNYAKSTTYHFKKQVEDLSSYIKTTAPSFSNFSFVFYDIKNNRSIIARNYRYNNEINNVENENQLIKQQAFINQKTIEILSKGNSKELEKLMQDFLSVSKEFDIANNLNVKDWSAMVYHPDRFEVKSFIKKYKPNLGEEYYPNKVIDGHYNEVVETAVVDSVLADDNSYVNDEGRVVRDTVSVKDFNPNVDREVSPKDFFKNNMSDYYYYTADLKTLLENVDRIKTDKFFAETVHIFLWIAFSLAVFIFSFRVTDLRSLLFGVVSGGVIILVVTLFCVASAFIFNMNSKFFILYTILLVGITILLLPFVTIRRFPKLVSSIFMIITMTALPLFFWLIFGIINEHQTAECYKRNMMTDMAYMDCHGIIDDLGFTMSYIIFILSFVFLYFYTGFIKKWKALPE